MDARGIKYALNFLLFSRSAFDSVKICSASFVLLLNISINYAMSGYGKYIWGIVLIGVISVAAWLAPGIFVQFRRMISFLSSILRHVAGLVALAIFYFAIVTPIGLIFRLVKNDFMRLRFDKNSDSYWIARKSRTPTPESFMHRH